MIEQQTHAWVHRLTGELSSAACIFHNRTGQARPLPLPWPFLWTRLGPERPAADIASSETFKASSQGTPNFHAAAAACKAMDIRERWTYNLTSLWPADWSLRQSVIGHWVCFFAQHRNSQKSKLLAFQNKERNLRRLSWMVKGSAARASPCGPTIAAVGPVRIMHLNVQKNTSLLWMRIQKYHPTIIAYGTTHSSESTKLLI